jgi:hypothetical protein
MKLRVACVVVGFLSFVLSLAAQNASSGSTSSQVPPLIQFSNIATDEGGNSLSGVVSITFSLYAGQRGGEPLWTETQSNIQLDPAGHYSVQLGITRPNGVPTALFITGEARWLGVRIAEQAEQSRVLLVSVPYALKAGDAATIGGLPPSAFVLATTQNGTVSASPTESAIEQSVPPPSGTVTGTGTVNFVPLWDTTSDIISSVLVQSGTGSTAKIGINTTQPASTLDVKGAGTIRGILSLPSTGTATTTKGANSQPLNLTASAFNSLAGVAINQNFHWQTEPVANDTTSASAKLSLLFGAGANPIAETGLSISSGGVIHFAAGQPLIPGTIMAVEAGTGLTGGGSSGSVTLGIAAAGVGTTQIASKAVTSAQVGSGTATSGQVLSADGGGGAAWQALTFPPGGPMGVTEFTSNGNFLVPAGVTRVRVDAYGAGGGGGGADTSSTVIVAGGGGGGGAYEGGVVAVTPGSTLTVVIGAAGATGSNASGTPTNGGNGGATQLLNGATVLISANGGSGGTASGNNTQGTGGSGGAAGTLSPGVNHSGINGQTPSAATFNQGNGGPGYIPPGYALLFTSAGLIGNGGIGGLVNGPTVNNAAAAGTPGYMLISW